MKSANMRTDPECGICKRVAATERGENPGLVHVFDHSVLVLADHQYHEGYCIMLLKEHYREIHEVPEDILSAMWQELMISTRAVDACFHPWKMNHMCLGNVDQHVHWHIIPRYESEPDHKSHPFLHMAEFPKHIVTPEQARSTAALLRERIEKNK